MSIEESIAANTLAINNLSFIIKKFLAVAPATEISAPAPKPEVELKSEPKPKPKPDTKPDVKVDMRGLFVEMGQACGKQSQLDLLKEFGSAKLSNIDPGLHGQVIEVMQKMILEAKNV